MNFIFIQDEEKAKELELLGFSYILSKANDKDLYCFAQTDELMKYLNEHFASGEYFANKLICF